MVTDNRNLDGKLLQEKNEIDYQPDTTWLFNPNVILVEIQNKTDLVGVNFFKVLQIIL